MPISRPAPLDDHAPRNVDVTVRRMQLLGRMTAQEAGRRMPASCALHGTSYACARSCDVPGVGAHLVEVELDVTNGLSRLSVVSSV